jgi:hypothetical protein
VLTTLLRSRMTTKTSNTFKSPRSSINIRKGGCSTCWDLTLRFTISQVKVWANQTHCQGELSMAQVKVIMTTSPSSPQTSFKSMHSQVQD